MILYQIVYLGSRSSIWYPRSSHEKVEIVRKPNELFRV